MLKNYILASLRIKDPALSKDFDEYVKLRDSIYQKDQSASLLRFEVENKTLEKESQIKTQQLEIEKEKSNRNMAMGGFGALSLLSLGGFLFYKNRQQKEKLKTQNSLLGLQKNLNEMQLANLNKQLDPHEIKNILANIAPEIQKNAPQAYEKMARLLNLTRASLNSSSITDSVGNQIQQVEDYLSLEKEVLGVSLNYHIENNLPENKAIPRLLLKNLAENSVKHGIRQKAEGGNISIKLNEKENDFWIEVEDTGIGRQKDIAMDSGIGTSTYINLFQTLNKVNIEKASFDIIDQEAGTKVLVKIPKNYQYS